MKTLLPLVTVYVVNHNYGKYLDQAVESILSQTFQDFELILIDNGSTDNSKEKLKKYSSDKKIKIIYQDNIGLNSANNVALNFARGEFIIRLDADDYFHKDALKVLSRKLESNKNLGLVFPDYYTVDQNGNILNQFRRHNFEEVELFDQPAHGACSMVRKQFLKAIGGYDETYHCQDGWDLWIRFMRKYGIMNVNKPLFFYRQHQKNLTKSKKKILDTRAKILRKNNKRDKTNCLAVIPIRGPSIDNSSLIFEKVGKKFVIDWTIDAALNSNRLSNIIITTSDVDVIKHLKKYYKDKINIHVRDLKFSQFGNNLDNTLTDLFKNLPQKLKNFNTLCILFTDYPLRDSKYIDMCLDAMDIFETSRVISVKKMNNVFYKHSGKTMVPIQKSKFLKKENEQVFVESGGIYVLKRGTVFNESPSDKKIGHIEIDEKASLNINEELALEIAEIFLKNEKV